MSRKTSETTKVKKSQENPRVKNKNPKVETLKEEIESPECNYKVPANKLVEILGSLGITEHKKMEELFTLLRKYEDYSVLNPPKKIPSLDVASTKPPFASKIVNALFWIKKGKYKFLRIKIAPSNIKEAGMGAYAVDPIPKGARGVYKGISKKEKYTNMYYSWTVKEFDPDTGEVTGDDTVYYIDAEDLNASNWTRYVNCGLKDRYNNIDTDQLYDKFFYVAMRDIEPGEELFTNYGKDYRRDNLGMTGKY